MSAIRNSSNRAEARRKRSTPYARGFIGTISRFLDYFTGASGQQHDEADVEDNNGRTTGSQLNGRQIVVSSPKSNFSSGSRAPLTPSNAYNGLRSALPDPSVPNAEQVASYFSQRMGTNVTTNEVESMITNLQTSPERERFRFTFTIPGQISSPSFSPSNVTPAASPSASPSKKLARNPNGVYRWEGAGSAKTARQRNRFASPAFGSPVKTPRSTAQETSESTVLGQDNKRRKVGEGASSASNGVPFPNMPSTPRTNGVRRQMSPSPSSRLRTPAKPTVPINPSPLRQAWSDASSTSSHEDNKPSPLTKPTKAANLVAELIKETAPPNKPDLSNPYQTASPVSKVGPPRRAPKRPRAVGRPPPPTKEQKAEEKKKEEEEKLKALSAQAIIEATLPKGSKRSRPPAHLENKPAGDTPRSPSPTRHTSVPTEAITYTIEEAEDSERPKKKSRSSFEESAQPRTLLTDVTVEEIEDVDMDKEKGKQPVKSTNNTNQLPRSVQFPGSKPSSVPREPSKLRFSFQAESSSSSSTPVSIPAPLPTLSREDHGSPSISSTVAAPAPPSIQVVANGFNFSFKSSPTLATPPKEKEMEPTVREAPKSPDVNIVKAQVRAMDANALPTFGLSPAGPTTFPGMPEHDIAREAAKAIQISSLPSFAFSITKSFSFGFDPTNPKPTVKESPLTFNFPPATKKSTTSSSNIFGTIPSDLSASPTATMPPSKLVGFDFAAAGVKPPVAAKDTWKCNQCGLLNPQDAKKCTICNEPKLGATISTSPPPSSSLTAPKAQVFDWAAAGIKAPTASHNTWTCGECGCSSPKSAIKCTVCDADAPGTASLAPKPAVPSTNMFSALAAKPVASSSVKRFDFEAAGMKRPSVEKGTWICSLCRLSNVEAASTCQTCDNPK